MDGRVVREAVVDPDVVTWKVTSGAVVVVVTATLRLRAAVEVVDERIAAGGPEVQPDRMSAETAAARKSTMHGCAFTIRFTMSPSRDALMGCCLPVLALKKYA